MTSFKRKLMADYHQLLIQDDLSFDGEVDWRGESMNYKLVTGKGYIVVASARAVYVDVEVRIFEAKPELAYENWDQVTECVIDIRSGIVRICGITDDYYECPTLTVEKHLYGVLVCFAGLGTISEDELDGEDSYHIFLWPTDSAIDPKIIKKWSANDQ